MPRILIVDDQPENIKLLASVLATRQYDIEFAVDGTNALHFLSTDDFDLILLDVMMPGIDGFEVCRFIRSGDRNKTTPVIFLTALHDIESIKQGFVVGAQDYISKPFNQAELLARVNMHLELKLSRDQLDKLNHHLEEEVAKRTAELEQANKQLVKFDVAKTEFLNSISNDIREPLNNILNAVHLLKDFADSKTIHHLVNALDQSVKRLESYSLLALSMSELRTKKYRYNPTAIVAHELIHYCLVDLIPIFNLHKINVNIPDAADDIVFSGDFELLLKSFRKNIESLILSSIENDTLTIRTKESDACLCFEIKNQKCMDNEFATVSNQSTESIEISYLQQVIELHKGKLEIAKNQNKIFGFRIQLPLKVKPA